MLTPAIYAISLSKSERTKNDKRMAHTRRRRHEFKRHHDLMECPNPRTPVKTRDRPDAESSPRLLLLRQKVKNRFFPKAYYRLHQSNTKEVSDNNFYSYMSDMKVVDSTSASLARLSIETGNDEEDEWTMAYHRRCMELRLQSNKKMYYSELTTLRLRTGAQHSPLIARKLVYS